MGNEVIKPQYKYVSHFSPDGYALVISDISFQKEDNDSLKIYPNSAPFDSTVCLTYGYINQENIMVVDTINHLTLSSLELDEWGGIKLKYILRFFSKGKSLFRSTMFDELLLCDGLFVYQDEKSKLFGYKDIKGNIKIEAKYSYCRAFSNGFSVVRQSPQQPEEERKDYRLSLEKSANSLGIINLEGRLVAYGYSYITDYNKKGLTWASKVKFEEKSTLYDWVQLDKNGKVTLGPLDDHWHTVAIINNYNDGKYPMCCRYDFLMNTFYYSFIDENGSLLSDFNHDGLISYGGGGDRAELFSDVIRFSEGIAGIKCYDDRGERLWFYVNNELNPISEPYDTITPFSGGLAAVKELTYMGDISSHKGKWGYVNRNFELVIPYSFSDCSPFFKGLAYFKNKGVTFNVEGYINKQGEIVWQTNRGK